MEQQIPFSEPKNTGSKKTLFIILGAVVAVVIIAFVATKGGGLKGSFAPIAPSTLQVYVNNATFLKSGDLALAYTMKNTGDTITNKDFYILFKGFVNRVNVPTFVKPWNDQGITELRTGETVTYNTIIPKSMFPKETYGMTEGAASGLPPSIAPIKTVEVKIFGFDSQGSEWKIATSGEPTISIEQ